VQLDVFGPIADLVYLLSLAGEPISDDLWLLLRDLLAAVASSAGPSPTMGYGKSVGLNVITCTPM